MNSKKAASPESATTGEKKKRRYLSAEKKYQIYLEAQRPDQPVEAGCDIIGRDVGTNRCRG